MAGNRKAQGDMGSAENAQAFATAHKTSKVLQREREFFIDDLMVRIHLIIVMILEDRPCAMGVLNSLFQIALYLPS